MRKLPIAIAHSQHSLRQLASYRWLPSASLVEDLSGLKRVLCTEGAKRCLQVNTSWGFRQWEVMPCGLATGPADFRRVIQELFGYDLCLGPVEDL